MGSRVTPPRATTFNSVRCRPASARPCASATSPSGTTAPRHSRVEQDASAGTTSPMWLTCALLALNTTAWVCNISLAASRQDAATPVLLRARPDTLLRVRNVVLRHYARAGLHQQPRPAVPAVSRAAAVDRAA